MPRVVDHSARRAEIVSAVIELIAQEGAEGVTVRKAATAAGVSAGALAHYFESKDELLAAAFAEIVARGNYRLRALSPDRDVEELLFQALLASLPLTRVRRIEARVWLAFLDRALVREEAGALLREVYAEWRRLIGEIVTRGQREGRFRADLDPGETATRLIAAVDGLTLQVVFDPAALAPDDLRRLVHAHVEALLAG